MHINSHQSQTSYGGVLCFEWNVVKAGKQPQQKLIHLRPSPSLPFVVWFNSRFILFFLERPFATSTRCRGSGSPSGLLWCRGHRRRTSCAIASWRNSLSWWKTLLKTSMVDFSFYMYMCLCLLKKKQFLNQFLNLGSKWERIKRPSISALVFKQKCSKQVSPWKASFHNPLNPGKG